MARNLVVCCDGTWNDPDELRDHVAKPTNVAKLALMLVCDDVDRQLMHYEVGVGTSPDDRIAGGAFGVGLSANIRDGYRFLVRNYADADRIFLFGFSRGAYTARSLAGLIHNCGLLRPECLDQADAAFALYRDRTDQTHPKTIAAHIFREMYSTPGADVYFIGVWDTVGALGIPDDMPGWKELSKQFHGWEQLWGFHDTGLSPEVKFAYHAVSIDEQRPPFKPTLWTASPDAPGDQVLEQVWFAGVHSEVGGGAANCCLSDIPLLWMVEKASAQGLLLTDGQPQTGAPHLDVPGPAPDYRAAIQQSERGLWEVFGHPYHRLTAPAAATASKQSVASSAARRFAERIDHYAPPGLQAFLDGHPVTEVPERCDQTR